VLFCRSFSVLLYFSSGHCVVCHSSNYGFWLPLCIFKRLAIVLSVLRFTDSDYPIITSKFIRSLPWLGWPLWNICVTNNHGYVPLFVSTSRFFPRSWLVIGFVTRLTRRVSLVEQQLLTRTEQLNSPPVFSGVRVTRSLVLYVCFVDRCLSFCAFSYGHCVVCSFSIYGFWLPIWYLQTLLSIFKLLSIVFSVLLLTDSDYPFGIFKQLVIILGVPRVTDSDYPLVSSSICPLCCLSFDLRILITLWYLQTFDHCVVCPSIYRFWLPLWPLQTFGHCVVCPPIYEFWVPFDIFKLLTIVLSVLRFTDSDYLFGIFKFWPLCCLSSDLRILITLWYLQTFDHCVVCPSIYRFWLPLWPLQTFGHCVVCSSIYGFWLPLWYIQILLWYSLVIRLGN
jgi:hypothetical protein